MATKKETVTSVVEEEDIYVDPIDKQPKVTIKLPVIPGARTTEYVSVNERTWLIKRGVPVTVPKCVVEQITHSEKMQQIAYERREAFKQMNSK